ncbi:protein FAM221B isoform 3-T3 [Discoglossus pictus]
MSQELLQGEGGAECESPPAGTDVPIDGAGTSQIDSEEPLSPQEEAKSITKKPLAGSRSFTNKPPGGAKENFPAGTRFSATPQSGAKSRARGYKKPAEDQTKNGLYVGWRCPEYRWDCFRLGENAKCFCGHFLSEHQNFTGHETKLPCCVGYCGCQSFSFIPSCPEEVGEMWLRSKYGFDPKTWKAKCVCKHSHEDHLPTGSHACRARACCCLSFESSFLCGACDRCWEAHQTYFETTEQRMPGRLPYGPWSIVHRRSGNRM